MKSENLNPLSIGPGDQVKDLRPLTYGKAYTVLITFRLLVCSRVG
jgi:hypothetical protein